MLSFKIMLTFCDGTYWPLVIIYIYIYIYIHYSIEDNCIKTLFMNWCRMFLLGIYRDRIFDTILKKLPTLISPSHTFTLSFLPLRLMKLLRSIPDQCLRSTTYRQRHQYTTRNRHTYIQGSPLTTQIILQQIKKFFSSTQM